MCMYPVCLVKIWGFQEPQTASVFNAFSIKVTLLCSIANLFLVGDACGDHLIIGLVFTPTSLLVQLTVVEW